jgi:hypothetical protein
MGLMLSADLHLRGGGCLTQVKTCIDSYSGCARSGVCASRILQAQLDIGTPMFMGVAGSGASMVSVETSSFSIKIEVE